MNVSRRRLKRAGALLSMVGATAGAALLLPAAAHAAAPIGADPGHLSFSPTSGAVSGKPTWATDTACSSSFNSSAKLYVVRDSGATTAVSTTITSVTAPFSGTLQASSIAQIMTVAQMQAGNTYEFVVMCQNATLAQDPEQSEFMTISADGQSYTTSSTPPVSTPTAVSTSTALTVPATAVAGSDVTLSATVTASDTAGNDAVGNVEFFNGTTSLGTAAVASGTASLTVSSLPVGSDSITARFEPTDSTKFTTSTSTAQTVTVTSASVPNAETVTVTVAPSSSGSLALSVDNTTPVTLTTPKNNGTNLDATGSLTAVTVADSRLPTEPGWNLTGAVGDFTAGTNKFSGNDLGWTPTISQANTANDVTAGAAVAAGAPGLGASAGLASATAGHGAGTTKVGANLDLRIPLATPAGTYNATLTVTLMSK